MVKGSHVPVVSGLDPFMSLSMNIFSTEKSLPSLLFSDWETRPRRSDGQCEVPGACPEPGPLGHARAGQWQRGWMAGGTELPGQGSGVSRLQAQAASHVATCRGD